VAASARYFAGGILLDASLEDVASPLPQDFRPVTVRFLALEEPLGDAAPGATIGSEARLLADYVEESPLQPIPRITAGSRVASGNEAARVRATISSGDLGRSAEAARLAGGLPAGVTAVFELAAATAAGEDAGQPGRRVGVHLHRSAPAAAGGGPGTAAGEEIRVAVVVEGPAPARPAATPSGKSAEEPTGAASALGDEPSAGEGARELVLLDPLVGEEGSFLVRVPSPFAGERPESIVAAVEIHPPRRLDLISLLKEDAALARAFTELAMHGTSPAPPPPRAGPAPLPGLASALAALGSPLSQRLGIIVLARETGARLAEDLALAAGEKLVAALAASVRRDLADSPVAPDRARTGFVLESRSITTLLEAMSKQKLEPGLQTVLLVHAGQAGAQAASLEDALRGSDGLEALRERIVEENLLALEDTSPAARVRAFDWLASRGRAPEGYDPFGSPRERRAALEKALQPVEASAQAPGGAAP
jgi:hypothetical protein